MFTNVDVRRMIASAAGALLLSLTCITAAVGPAQAAVLPLLG